MSSFINCVVDQLRERKIPDEEIANLLSMYEEIKADQVSKGLDADQASIIADEQLLEYAQEFDKGLQLAMRQVVANDNIDTFVARHKGFEAVAADKLMQDVHSAKRSVFNELMSTLAPVIDQMAPKLFKGLKTKQDVSNLLIKMIDGDMSHPITQAAHTALTAGRERFVAAGGFMGESKKPYVPFRYLPDEVNNFFDKQNIPPAQRADKFAEIMYERMDTAVSFPKNTKDEIIQILKESYDNISSQGVKDSFSFKKKRKAGFYNKRNQKKYFYAKDAQSLGEIYDMFGGGRERVIDNVFYYMEGISKDIALMEKFGPSVDEGYARLREKLVVAQGAEKTKGVKQRAKDIATGAGTTDVSLDFLDAQYAVLKDADFASGDNLIANGAAVLRRWLSMVSLGGALISALGDSLFISLSARQYGKKLGVTKSFFDNLQVATVGKRGQKEYLKSIGDTIHMFQALNDIEAREHSLRGSKSKVMRGLNNLTFKWTGFSRWVRATRHSVALDMARELKFESRKSWENIKPDFRSILADRGMTKELWEGAVRKYDATLAPHGSTLFDHALLRADDKIPIELRYKAARAIDEARILVENMASNENNLIARTLSEGAGAPKYVKPAISGFSQFKSFTISQMNFHLNPMVRKVFNETGLAKRSLLASDMAVIAAKSAAIGVAINQISDITSGRTPEQVFERDGSIKGEVLARGFVRTGFGGLYADLALAPWVASKYGKEMSDVLFDFASKDAMASGMDMYGPIVSGTLMDDKKALARAKKSIAKAFYRYGIPKPHFARLFLDNDVKRAFMHLADPKSDKNYAKWEKKMRKETGQTYWYRGLDKTNKPEKILESWERDWENAKRNFR